MHAADDPGIAVLYRSPSRWAPGTWRTKGVLQQPLWPDATALHKAARRVSTLPPLVSLGEIQGLAQSLAAVAKGRAFLLQGGDCVESFHDQPSDVRRRRRLLDETAREMEISTGFPVVRVGRLAGQFAKPRSAPMEAVGGAHIPTFRGHIVHEEAATPEARTPDPARLVWAYHRAASVLDLLRHDANSVDGSPSRTSSPYQSDPLDRFPARRDYGELSATIPTIPTIPWTSHEALLLEYEEALTRWDETHGVWYDSSAHFLWVGERTRQGNGAHVEFLSGISNPLGCKVGPSATPEEVVDICHRLDPGRQPGRLTLITRLGAANAADRLPSLIQAVRNAGHPVIWLCDPMHGNSSTALSGRKTRRIPDILHEADAFFGVHHHLGTWPGGLHLEMTGDDVAECSGDDPGDAAETRAASYRSLCDPRLNPHQLLQIVRGLAPRLPRRFSG
jgi:3-deoxy-7-phosphoheptulonate synthase